MPCEGAKPGPAGNGALLLTPLERLDASLPWCRYPTSTATATATSAC